MQKLAIVSALFLAANGMGTTYTYDSAEMDCFTWDDTTSAYVAGDYLASFAVDSTDKNTAGTKYNYAFDVSFDATATDEYDCDQVFKQAWSVEWDVSDTDATSTDDMFVVYYEAWTADSTDYCSGDYADDLSTMYTSGVDETVNSTVCAYDVWFNLGDGSNATDTIDATTQNFTIYTDSAIVAAASFAAAGVAAMFL